MHPPSGDLRSIEFAVAAEVTSTLSRTRWIAHALGRDLIKPTKESLLDPHTACRLTNNGEVTVGSHKKIMVTVAPVFECADSRQGTFPLSRLLIHSAGT